MKPCIILRSKIISKICQQGKDPKTEIRFLVDSRHSANGHHTGKNPWYYNKLIRRSVAGYRAFVCMHCFLCFLGSYTLKHKNDNANRFLCSILTRNVIFGVLFIFTFATPWTVTRIVGCVRTWLGIWRRNETFCVDVNTTMSSYILS
jgi:hypothetical protein